MGRECGSRDVITNRNKRCDQHHRQQKPLHRVRPAHPVLLPHRVSVPIQFHPTRQLLPRHSHSVRLVSRPGPVDAGHSPSACADDGPSQHHPVPACFCSAVTECRFYVADSTTLPFFFPSAVGFCLLSRECGSFSDGGCEFICSAIIC